MRGLWTDHRIGGHPRVVHCDSRDLMQLPDEVRKLVCFVRRQGAGRAMIGTGFFVAEPLGIPDDTGDELSVIYIVTARHCVQQIDPTDPDDPPAESIHVRVNTRNGGSEWIKTDPDLWVHHETADVSVYNLAPGRDKFDYLYYPIRKQAGPFYLTHLAEDDAPPPETIRIGPGAEVFLTGLLIYHPGETRIMPIIRVGNIAAFPEDTIELSTGPDSGLILIESRSLGGLSGSPVFVHFPPWRYDSNWNVAHLMPPVVPGNAGPNYLLGVVHGYYPTTGNDPDGLGDASGEPLNTGISVVVPIERAIELIDGSILGPEREAIRADLKRKTMPKAASGSLPSSSLDRTADLLGKLLRVPKEEADEVHRGHQP